MARHRRTLPLPTAIDPTSSSARAVFTSRSMTALRRHWLRLRRHRRGIAAIEFGLLAPIFLVLLCGIIENGLILLTQTVLDNATRDASRLIMLGDPTTGSAPTASIFSTALCNGASTMVPCANIKYSVVSGSTFAGLNTTLQTDANGNMINMQYSPGTAQQAVLVQVGYNRPFLIPWYGLFSGVKSELLVSTRALKSEPY